LSKPGYRCQPLALGINTDGWQPVERRTGLTRRLLEVLDDFGHPVSIVTKSALIERDLDILARVVDSRRPSRTGALMRHAVKIHGWIFSACP
ncbi:MAG: hypothetical protein ACP5IY_03250, partial [Halothiobacillaceae bacterium]